MSTAAPPPLGLREPGHPPDHRLAHGQSHLDPTGLPTTPIPQVAQPGPNRDPPGSHHPRPHG